MASKTIMDAAPTLDLFEDRTYPSQLRAGADARFSGEYRGYYPGTYDWKPKSSTFKGRCGGKHGGLDIYAPFALQAPRNSPPRPTSSMVGCSKISNRRAANSPVRH